MGNHFCCNELDQFPSHEIPHIDAIFRIKFKKISKICIQISLKCANHTMQQDQMNDHFAHLAQKSLVFPSNKRSKMVRLPGWTNMPFQSRNAFIFFCRFTLNLPAIATEHRQSKPSFRPSPDKKHHTNEASWFSQAEATGISLNLQLVTNKEIPSKNDFCKLPFDFGLQARCFQSKQFTAEPSEIRYAAS